MIHASSITNSLEPSVVLNYWININIRNSSDYFPPNLNSERFLEAVKNAKAIISDFDGVFLNDLHLGAIFDLTLRKSGVFLSPEEICYRGKLFASSGKIDDNLISISKDYGITMTSEDAFSALKSASEEISKVTGGKLIPAFSMSEFDALTKILPIAIATSKTKSDLVMSLHQFGISDEILLSVTREDVPDYNSDPKGLTNCLSLLSNILGEKIRPDEVIMIGDMRTDGEAARAAGINFIGVVAPMDWASRIDSQAALMGVDAIAVFPSTDDAFRSIREARTSFLPVVSLEEALHKTNSQILTLSDDLVSQVLLGMETTTIRMGDKYKGNTYQPGVATLVTPSGVNLEVIITEATGMSKKISDITPDELKENGIDVRDTDDEIVLEAIKLTLVENMKQWYPLQEFDGLNTKVYLIKFYSPITKALNSLCDEIKNFISEDNAEMFSLVTSQFLVSPLSNEDPKQVHITFSFEIDSEETLDIAKSNLISYFKEAFGSVTTDNNLWEEDPEKGYTISGNISVEGDVYQLLESIISERSRSFN